MALRMNLGIPIRGLTNEVTSRRLYKATSDVPFQVQQGDRLCWAACTSMVESVRGTLRRTQCQLVEQVMDVEGCCSERTRRCDVASTSNLIFATLRRSCPRAKSQIPVDSAWLVNWLDRGLVMALWDWSGHRSQVSQHVVLIVGYHRVGAEPVFILHDPLTSGPEPVSYSALAEANGAGRWITAWVGL